MMNTFLGKILLFYTIAIIFHMKCSVNAQENIQTRIPNSLIECYQLPEILQRDNRLPMTINILIELIRKIEDTPAFQDDMRVLTTQLLHRFRLDGIERAPGVFQSANIIPFSPSSFPFSKHRILLSRLIPLGAGSFPNETLTALERCALHFMLSHSVETQVRGDENIRCGQLAQFRAMRIPRGYDDSTIKRKRSIPVKTNFMGDISWMDEIEEHNNRKLGRYQMLEGVDGELEEGGINEGEVPVDGEGNDEQPIQEGEGENVEDEYIDPNVERNLDAGLIDMANNVISQCPVENGVITTPWGAVSAGALIAGIAAGLLPQALTIRQLLDMSRASQGQQRARQVQGINVENIWAATLAGDLSEVSLLQGPVTQQIAVGAAGAWNSTHVPRWYFISQRERFEMTDAEIRGGLDGLILGSSILEWRQQAPQLRLSQLLDMYYSQRGVLGTPSRACDRRILFTSVAPVQQMNQQTTAFSTVLDREMQLRVTLTPEAIQQFSESAVQSLSTYVPNSLNDLTCGATSIIPNDQTIWRSATDLLIYIDIAWPFNQIQSTVAHLLNNLDVGRFGTTYTLLNAMDGRIIVNTTNSLTDLYTTWNAAVHVLHPVGLNLPNIIQHIRNTSRALMEFERQTSAVGGSSLVALIVPQAGGVAEGDANFVAQQIFIMRETEPDVTLLFLAAGAIQRFSRFVREESRDLFPLQVSGNGDNAAGSVNPVISRIQQIPRRIINHRCGSDWRQTEWGSNNMNQFVEPGGIVFYRIHPNYFFHPSENRRLRIQGHNYPPISVCMSRSVQNPRANSTQQANIDCRQLVADTFEINLSNACDGHWLINNCPPVFISVEGILQPGAGGSQRMICTDHECRFPDSIRFGINTENLGCFNGAKSLMGTISLIIGSILLLLIKIS